MIVPGASVFRSGDMDATLRQLQAIDFNNPAPGALSFWRANIKTQEDLDYAYSLQGALKKMTDVFIRVESPWISVYTNTKKYVDDLIKLDPVRIKYVSTPPEGELLETGTIILPKIDYDYKITLGKTNHENSAFVEWAESNSKVKLTKSCIKHLLRNESWGGSYSYISGEKNLLVAKMHLGGTISKIERILKS